MIITNPKVIEYIERFEAIKASNPPPITELSEKEQKILYTMTEMFSMDEIFKAYIALIVHDFAKKRTTSLNEGELSKTLLKIVDFALSLNYKGE